MVKCARCLLPDTKPGLKFNENGICSACQHVEQKKYIDYKKRYQELTEISMKYKNTEGKYDCIIPVSGGKDSTFQVYIMKNKLNMNPLLVHVDDEFEKTKAGIDNLNNLSDNFNCDMITLKIGTQFNKIMMQFGLEELGYTNWAVDKAIYSWPLRVAINFGIKLIVYGEDVTWEYGGVLDNETYSAKQQIYNDVVKPIKELDMSGKSSEWNAIRYPTQKEIEESGIEPIFLSYFIRWGWIDILKTAKENGFKSLENEWLRKGYADDFIQIDSVGYLFNYYLKYLKLGWSQTTHYVSNMIRWGHFDKEYGQYLINRHEGLLDDRILNDFSRVIGWKKDKIMQYCYKWNLYKHE